MNRTFDIISFTANNLQYYPAFLGRQIYMDENWVPHTEMDFPLGQSRYGGAIVDLPPGEIYPEELRFAAQLDMTVFSQYDKTGMLPKTGQLLFFADPLKDAVKVIYENIPNDKLIRTIREHKDMFFSGVLIDQVMANTETLESRYRDWQYDWEEEEANGDGKVWDNDAADKQSKIFGIYTHCQWGEQEILEVVNSDKVVLLQVGENGFNDEGVFSVLIPKQDLINKDFSRCECTWAQT